MMGAFLKKANVIQKGHVAQVGWGYLPSIYSWKDLYGGFQK